MSALVYVVAGLIYLCDRICDAATWAGVELAWLSDDAAAIADRWHREDAR